jgi:hypothetical protein
MSFTYTYKPATNDVDKVRFHIQDVDEASMFLHDEEIQYIIDKYGIGNLDAICSEACETMASRYAKKQEIAVSNYNQNLDSVYKKLIARALQFKVNSVTVDSFRCPAMSKFSKDMQAGNDDNVQSSFQRDMFDNPQATTNPLDKTEPS